MATMADRAMDENYARLSLTTGMLASKLDSYLGRHHFITKARAQPWSLSEEVLDAWRKEAREMGVPERAMRLTKRERAKIEETIPFALSEQAKHDNKRRQ